jgi:hypothetical protein
VRADPEIDALWLSRTAAYMALFAIESSRPADSRLFHDPLAVAFLDRRL